MCICLCMLCLVAAYFTWQKTKRREEDAMIEASSRMALVNELEQYATDKLSDPDSVRYRDLILYHDPNSSPLADKYFGEYRLCGELNAKNRFGGYVGYRSFIAEMYIGIQGSKIVHGAGGAFIDDNESANDDFFSGLKDKDCKGPGESVEP